MPLLSLLNYYFLYLFIGEILMGIVCFILMWICAKPKRRAVRQPYLKKNLEKLNDDLSTLFNNVSDKYCFEKELITFVGVGVQHHRFEFESYPQGFVCGYIEREHNNPKYKKGIRLADIKGKTIGYLPKDKTKDFYETFGDEFQPRPFYGKVLWNDEGTKAIVDGFTYGFLHDEKEGKMNTLAEYIINFPLKSFSYYRGVN